MTEPVDTDEDWQTIDLINGNTLKFSKDKYNNGLTIVKSPHGQTTYIYKNATTRVFSPGRRWVDIDLKGLVDSGWCDVTADEPDGYERSKDMSEDDANLDDSNWASWIPNDWKGAKDYEWDNNLP